jgi:hypothetical protein
VNRRALVHVVATVVVAVFALGIWSTGEAVQLAWLRFYSLAILAAVSIVGLWEHFLWRWSIFQRLASVPRDITGTWSGTLTSLWKDPATLEVPAPKKVFLVVRQTASSVSVVLLSDESRSNSTFGRVVSDGGTPALEYLYLNRPDSRVEHRSRMHHGSAVVDISGRPASRLRGRYWTNRDSRGEMDFVGRRPAYADDFEQAHRFFAT